MGQVRRYEPWLCWRSEEAELTSQPSNGTKCGFQHFVKAGMKTDTSLIVCVTMFSKQADGGARHAQRVTSRRLTCRVDRANIYSVGALAHYYGGRAFPNSEKAVCRRVSELGNALFTSLPPLG